MVRALATLLFFGSLTLGAQPVPADRLVVDFLDVGQADSILVRQGTEALLIDAGNNGDAAVITGVLADRGVTRLVAVVATHAHEDHIGAMDVVLRSFNVGAVWFPRQTTNTITYRDFLLAVRDRGLKLQAPEPGIGFDLGAARVTFLGPPAGPQDDLNEGSAVLRIDFGATSFLFTGDAGKEAEGRLVRSGQPLGATVLKVGHHGSSGSTTAAFLKAVHPLAAVIPVGEGNTYGHPSKTVVDRLARAGVVVYRTDRDGTVTAVSDGATVTFTPTNPSPGP